MYCVECKNKISRRKYCIVVPNMQQEVLYCLVQPYCIACVSSIVLYCLHQKYCIAWSNRIVLPASAVLYSQGSRRESRRDLRRDREGNGKGFEKGSRRDSVRDLRRDREGIRLMQRGYAFPVARRVVRRRYAPGCFFGLCAEGSFWQIYGDTNGFHKLFCLHVLANHI